MGPAVIALGLSLGMGLSERRATATAKGPSPEIVAEPTHEAAKASPTVQPEKIAEEIVQETVEETAKPAKAPVITPMGRREAISFLADAWQESQGEAPSSSTLAVLCAHWSHETDHGRRMHAFNFGGIKGAGPSGASVMIWTRENGETERLVRRTFRAYASPEEGARDYVNLLVERYSVAFRAAREASIERFVSGLGSRGYFTDDEQTYLRSLARLVRDCARDLERPPSEP